MPRTKELPLPPQGELEKLFRYDARTGKLFWKKRPRRMFDSDHRYRSWNAQYAGREAFTTLCNGHLRGLYDGQHIYAHRLIWKLRTGEEPPEIDHINGVATDNRWINLRAANRAVNNRNSSRRSDNSSGVTGVSRRGDRWIAQIMVRGQVKHLGVYDDLAEAAAARQAAEKILGYHQNHGRP